MKKTGTLAMKSSTATNETLPKCPETFRLKVYARRLVEREVHRNENPAKMHRKFRTRNSVGHLLRGVKIQSRIEQNYSAVRPDPTLDAAPVSAYTKTPSSS